MGLSSTYRGVRELQGSYCVYILKNIGLLKKKKKKKKKKTPRCPTISNKKTKTNKQRNDKKTLAPRFQGVCRSITVLRHLGRSIPAAIFTTNYFIKRQCNFFFSVFPLFWKRSFVLPARIA